MVTAGSHTDVDLTVTCSGSSALVSWSAPANSIVNLQYHCFWTTNNTQVSSIVDGQLNSCHAACKDLVEYYNAVIILAGLRISSSF